MSKSSKTDVSFLRARIVCISCVYAILSLDLRVLVCLQAAAHPKVAPTSASSNPPAAPPAKVTKIITTTVGSKQGFKKEGENNSALVPYLSLRKIASASLLPSADGAAKSAGAIGPHYPDNVIALSTITSKDDVAKLYSAAPIMTYDSYLTKINARSAAGGNSGGALATKSSAVASKRIISIWSAGSMMTTVLTGVPGLLLFPLRPFAPGTKATDSATAINGSGSSDILSLVVSSDVRDVFPASVTVSPAASSTQLVPSGSDAPSTSPDGLEELSRTPLHATEALARARAAAQAIDDWALGVVANALDAIYKLGKYSGVAGNVSTVVAAGVADVGTLGTQYRKAFTREGAAGALSFLRSIFTGFLYRSKTDRAAAADSADDVGPASATSSRLPAFNFRVLGLLSRSDASSEGYNASTEMWTPDNDPPYVVGGVRQANTRERTRVTMVTNVDLFENDGVSVPPRNASPANLWHLSPSESSQAASEAPMFSVVTGSMRKSDGGYWTGGDLPARYSVVIPTEFAPRRIRISCDPPSITLDVFVKSVVVLPLASMASVVLTSRELWVPDRVPLAWRYVVDAEKEEARLQKDADDKRRALFNGASKRAVQVFKAASEAVAAFPPPPPAPQPTPIKAESVAAQRPVPAAPRRPAKRPPTNDVDDSDDDKLPPSKRPSSGVSKALDADAIDDALARQLFDGDDETAESGADK